MGKKIKFSDRYIQKTLQPKEERYEILEGDGFTARVTPAGVKTFYYVYKIKGKNRRLRLGEYPHTSLAEAREEHRRALSQRKKGLDPVAMRQEEQRAREEEDRRRQNELTTKQLVAYYLKEHAKPNKRSWKKDEYLLEKEVLPIWGDWPAKDVKKRDVIRLMETIKDRGAPNQSHQVLKIVRRMFNFAIERDILESTPCYMVKPLVKPASKERWLTEREIRQLWGFLEDPKASRLSDAMRRGLRLILITAQRPGECLELPWNELKEKKWWTLPPQRTKNGREHRVFLPSLAREQLTPNDTDYAFPSSHKKSVPMQEDAAARAVRRLVTPQGKNKAIKLPIAPFTPHDLRRTCATHLGSLGYTNEQIGKVLNHVDGTVTGIYNRHLYDDLKKEMLLAWEKRLREILSNKE